MKILRKLNRGAILSFFILVFLIVYLVILEFSHSAEIPKIKAQCEKYIGTEISYKMLPKQYRVEKPSITQSELDLYLANMEKDIKAFYPQNEQSSKFIIDNLKSSLLAQAEGDGVVYEYKKEILKYNDLLFDNDTVTVNFTTNSVYEGQNPNNLNLLAKSEKITSETEDMLILQKINGDWKIVYSNLNLPYDQNNMGGQPQYYKGMIK